LLVVQSEIAATSSGGVFIFVIKKNARVKINEDGAMIRIQRITGFAYATGSKGLLQQGRLVDRVEGTTAIMGCWCWSPVVEGEEITEVCSL
jgi:hypothetical protein